MILAHRKMVRVRRGLMMNEKDKNTPEKDVAENVASPIPKSLKRAGLKKIETNLQPGEALNVPGESIWLLFQNEIQKAFWADDNDKSSEEKKENQVKNV